MEPYLGWLEAARQFLTALKPVLVELFVILAFVLWMVKALKEEFLRLF